jgi:hypothetical protein
MIKLMGVLMLAAGLATAQEKVAIIPVTAWPKTVSLGDKIIYNATPADAVKAGYRLIPAKPATPVGKVIKSETLVQDEGKADKVKWVIVYEDEKPPVIVPPETLVEVKSDRVAFQFTTNGQYRGVTWLDAPVTNGAPK